MPSLGLRTAERPNTKAADECVLLIEANANVAAEIQAELNSATDERFLVEWVTELSSGIERLRNGGVGAVVLDLTLPDSHGIETFDKLFQASPRVPILIVSGAGAEKTARQEIQRGAQDYLVKTQADGYRLRQAVRRMMNRRATEATLLENEVANATLDSIEEAVLRTDICGNFMYLNRMAEKMTGWPREEALGHPVADILRIIDGVSRAGVRDAVEIVLHEDKTGRVTTNRMNCILVRRDGFEFGIENRVTPIHDEGGSVTGELVALQ